MKKAIAVVQVLICMLIFVGCDRELPTNEQVSSSATDTKKVITLAEEIYEVYGSISYACNLTEFPKEDVQNWFGEIIWIEEDRLLVSPGLDEGKEEYGEVVWLVFDQAWAYSIGQVVTYTFCDVKAPDKEGEPLNIVALLVYME
jgi:hypothetical protein